MAATSPPSTDSSQSAEQLPLPQLSAWRAALVGHHRPTHSRRWSGFHWQVLLLVPPSLLYFFVRDLSAGQEREAFDNAASIVDFEKALGLDWEATLQSRILDTDWVVAAMNWVYIYGHFPLIVASLVLLFGLSRRNFITLRNALVASGAVGLVCFALYPVAPPRLFDPNLFFDSLSELSNSYHIFQNPKVTNQFAAVPSFHVGWNLLVAFSILRSTRLIVLRVIAVAFPLLMTAAVILTANHWLVDIVAGVSVAAIGIVGAQLMDRGFRRLAPAAARVRDIGDAHRAPGAVALDPRAATSSLEHH